MHFSWMCDKNNKSFCRKKFWFLQYGTFKHSKKILTNFFFFQHSEKNAFFMSSRLLLQKCTDVVKKRLVTTDNFSFLNT